MPDIPAYTGKHACAHTHIDTHARIQCTLIHKPDTNINWPLHVGRKLYPTHLRSISVANRMVTIRLVVLMASTHVEFMP